MVLLNTQNTVMFKLMDKKLISFNLKKLALTKDMVLNWGQGLSWTEIYFGHFVQAAPILFGHLEIFRTLLTLIFTTINGNCHLPFSYWNQG